MPLFEKIRRAFHTDHRRGAPRNTRALRLEPLEERTLLTGAPTRMVTSFSDIQNAMASIASGGEIEIQVAGDITLTGGQGVTITSGQSVTVTSVGQAKIQGSGSVDRSCSLFSVEGGELILHSVLIDGLKANTSYSDINVKGAVVKQTGGSVTVSGSTQISNCSAYNGGAFYVEVNNSTGIDMAVVGGKISGCAANNGGAVYVKKGTVDFSYDSDTLTFANVTSNSAVASGGALYIGGSGVVTTRGSGSLKAQFHDNTANNGGAIYAYSGSSLTIHSASLQNNSAESNGGAILLAGGGFPEGTITVDSDSVIHNNTAFRYGGAFSITGGTVNISETVTISSNKADGGGGFFVNGGGSLTVSGGTISGNNALSFGGAVYLVDSTMVVEHGTFSGNSASRDGGVFYLLGKSQLTVGTSVGQQSDVQVIKNKATFQGGVFCIAYDPDSVLPAGQDGPEVVIYNGTFGGVDGDGNSLGNSAGSGGVFGVIGDTHANITVHDGTFSYNKVSGQAHSGGGVFYLENTGSHLLTIKNGYFGHNSSQNSGGVIELAGNVAGSGNTVVLEQGTFEYNLASDGDGGVINNEQALSSVTIGKAGASGAVSMAHNSAEKSNAETLLAGYGGALYSVGTVTLGKTSFAGNSADLLGGALAMQGASLIELSGTTADEKTFSGNSALNGGAIASSGNVTLNSAVFSGNYTTGGNGGAIDMISTNGTLTLGNCSFTNNSALGVAGTTGPGGIDWSQPELLLAGDGGAIQNWGSAVLSDCYFEGNSAHDGGAIANGAQKISGTMYLASLTISQTVPDEGSENALVFKNNKALYGGAVINAGTFTRAANETVGILFQGNSSIRGGGAISNTNNGGAVTDGFLRLNNAIFSGNTAGSTAAGGSAALTGSGGAIINQIELLVSDSLFQTNYAYGDGCGGAVDNLLGGTVELINDTFDGNIAGKFGGAVHTWDNSSAEDCTFTGNRATNGGAFSAISFSDVVDGGHTTTITDSVFSGNSAKYGGAMQVIADVILDAVVFNNNSASSNGGAISLVGQTNLLAGYDAAHDNAPIYLVCHGNLSFQGTATSFTNNKAPNGYGGAIASGYGYGAQMPGPGDSVINAWTMPTFQGNTAGKGPTLAIDRTILNMAPIPGDTSNYYYRALQCAYTAVSSGDNLWTVTVTAMATKSAIDHWTIDWGNGTIDTYSPGGAALPAARTIAAGSAVTITAYSSPTESPETVFQVYELTPELTPQDVSPALESFLDELETAYL